MHIEHGNLFFTSYADTEFVDHPFYLSCRTRRNPNQCLFLIGFVFFDSYIEFGIE